jgi:hypothetical protein
MNMILYSSLSSLIAIIALGSFSCARNFRLASTVSALALAGLAVAPASAGAIETPSEELTFSTPAYYDAGIHSSIAVHSSSLVLEFHKSPHSTDIWYRFGSISNDGVSWGAATHAGFWGYWPSVAISKEGYVIAVHSDFPTRLWSTLERKADS